MNINKDYISKVNTYTGQNVPKYIVIHETDNWNNGAGAQRHSQAQYNGNLSTSVHYYCGSDGVYQTANHSDGTYSIGVEYGGNHSIKDATNKNSINVEICVNPDGNYNTARANAIELVRYLIQTTGIPAERVIRHFDAKGKYCPRNMMDNPALWEDFKKQISNSPSPSQTTQSQTTQSQTKPNIPNYVVGNIYTLQAEMRVRTGPGTNYRAKTHSELTADGQKHDRDGDGALDQGTQITCKEVVKSGDEIWIKAPSGYIAAVHEGNIYIK